MPFGGSAAYLRTDASDAGGDLKQLSHVFGGEANSASKTGHGTGGVTTRQVRPLLTFNGTGGRTAVPAAPSTPANWGWRLDPDDLAASPSVVRSVIAGTWSFYGRVWATQAQIGNDTTITAILYKNATEIGRGSVAVLASISDSGTGFQLDMTGVAAQTFDQTTDYFQVEFYITAPGVAVLGQTISFKIGHTPASQGAEGVVLLPAQITTVATLNGRLSGAGVMSGARRADVRRATLLSGIGVMSGVRRADQRRDGQPLVGQGFMSGVRGADARRSPVLVGTGRISGTRNVVASRSVALLGGGRLSGVRGADLLGAGLVAGMGFLSGVRRAEQRRTVAVIGAGRLSGSHQVDVARLGALIGAGVLAATRRVEATSSGAIVGGGALSGIRGADRHVTGMVVGEGILVGARGADALRNGALVGGPNRLKGWGIVLGFGLSGTTKNADGTQILPGVTVDIFRTSDDVRLATAISDALGHFAFTLTSDPITYYLRGHYDDGSPANQHLIDTTDEEWEAEVTQVQGPTQPSDD